LKSLLIAAFCVASASVLAAPVEGGKAYYCEGKLVASLDGKSRETSLTAWMKSPTKFRMEQKTGGETQVMIGNGSNVWMYSPSKKDGIHKVQDAQSLAILGKRSRILGDDLDKLTQSGAKKTGTETLDGSKCDVYTLKMPNGLVHTVWIIQGPDKLTKREKLSGTTRASMGPGQPMQNHTLDRLVTYNWKIGIRMDESLFKPAAGIKLKEYTQPPANPFAQPGAPSFGPGPKK
jgi:hypothetical protein